MAAAIAVPAGERPGIWAMPVPSATFSVTALRWPRIETTSLPHASATQTESSPSASASFASSICSSGENQGQ